MLRNYFKIALRNLAKHKYFTFVNAIGLALGMSFSLLLISFYSYVVSFDDFHEKRDRIYRIISTIENGVDKTIYASAPLGLANKLRNDATGITDVVRIQSSFHGDVVSDKLNIPLSGYYADAAFFDVFDFELISGNRHNALSKPNSIVLTESFAKKIDPSGNILGDAIEIDGLGLFEVTGVVKDERRTHFLFEALVSLNTVPAAVRGEESGARQWKSFNDQYVYLLTGSKQSSENLQRILEHISTEVNGQTQGQHVLFQLQALGDITPGPDLENSLGPDSDYTLLFVFGTICLLILLPAVFNYSNISIARALKRSKEVGLRKTIGGTRLQIFLQFVIETIAVMIISLVGSLLVFIVIRPEFEDMMPGGWLDLSLTWEMAGMFLVFTLAIGFLAGVFPAMHFAGLNPIQALKNQVRSKSGSKMLARRALVIFQFALSFCFLICLIVFGRQYQYTVNYDYGFDTEHILDVQLQGVSPATFKSGFSGLSSIQDISMSSDILGASYSHAVVRNAGGDSLEVAQVFADAGYIQNMGLELLVGSTFSEVPTVSKLQIIVNEEFLRKWQIADPHDAVGQAFIVDNHELEIIGVLKDFHFASLQVPITSFFFRNDASKFAYANMKVASIDMHSSIATMEETWKLLNADRRLEAHFFDDEMEQVYFFYEALLKMIGYLGLLAVSISILGLLGMVVYTTETRTKEVGIRKVFGANESGLVYLLSKDFLRLMVWAVLLAVPISVFLFDDLLSTVQYYRVSLSVWDLFAGALIFLVIGLATIMSQTRKAARTNPINTLRYE